MKNSRTLGAFVKQIYRIYILERPTHFAASLAYYSLFSLVPIIYVAFSVAGLFLDNELTSEQLVENVQSVFGVEVADLLVTKLENLSEGNPQSSMLQRVMSFAAMLAGASLLFFQFQYALNSIWKVPPPKKGGARRFLVNRLLAFVMVLCVGLLVALITLANFVMSLLDSQLDIGMSNTWVSFGTTLAVGTVSMALIFKFLSNTIVSWKDVVVGAFVTALLLIAGANLLGSYVVRGFFGSAFEAAGTVAMLLISIFFLAQFLVFGTVFTRVYANMFGDGIR